YSRLWAVGFGGSFVYKAARYALAARRDRRYREPAFVFSDRLYPGAHAAAGPWNPGFDRLVLRGHPRDPRRSWSFVVVRWHARAELSFRDHLGADHRGHPSRKNHRCERDERGFRAGRCRYGGSRARVWGRLGQNLFSDLATVAHAQSDASGSHELRQRRRRDG